MVTDVTQNCALQGHLFPGITFTPPRKPLKSPNFKCENSAAIPDISHIQITDIF